MDWANYRPPKQQAELEHLLLLTSISLDEEIKRNDPFYKPEGFSCPKRPIGKEEAIGFTKRCGVRDDVLL